MNSTLGRGATFSIAPRRVRCDAHRHHVRDEDGASSGLDALQRLMRRSSVSDPDRNARIPDFNRMLYVFRAGAVLVIDGEMIRIPEGWLVVDRWDYPPDDQRDL